MKRILSTALAAALCCGMLASCGGDTGENTGVANKNYDPMGKYETPVTVNCVLGYGDPTDKNVPKSTTPENQAFNRLLKDELNIEINYLWTVPESQFEQKFSTAIASNSLPDIMALDQKNFEYLKENDMLADLTEAYKYASPQLKEMIERDPAVLESVTQDGKLLAIPRYSDVRGAAPLLWLRKDWMDKLNLEMPKTWADVENIAKQFAQNDPDGNGKKDTYGFGASAKSLSPWGFGIKPMFMPYGSFVDKWIDDGTGKLVSGNIQPETKKALTELSRMYQEGLFDRELFTKNEDQVSEDIISGKIGLILSEWWFAEFPVPESITANEKAKWVCVEIPPLQEGGQPTITLDRQQVLSYYVVNKNFKNPEVLLKGMNVFIQSETTYKDVLTAENGHVWSWCPMIYLDPYEIDTTYKNVNEAYENGTPVTSGQEQEKLERMADYEAYKKGNMAWDSKKMFGGLFARVDKQGGWATAMKAVSDSKVVYNEFTGASTRTMIDNGATLEKLTEETFIKIIAGEKSVDEFDKYVETWKNLGGDKITEEVNEWYKQ